jgi:hypothetical protein
MSDPQPPVKATSASRKGLPWIAGFLLLLLLLEANALVDLISRPLPDWLTRNQMLVRCGLIGGIGGITYCLRAIYLNACVRNCWDTKWWPWYLIRPIVSLICGCASYGLLKAGLLVLDASPKPEGNHLGFFVLAFIAGLNVDKFLLKVEEVAQTTWGIEKSRASSKDDPPK